MKILCRAVIVWFIFTGSLAFCATQTINPIPGSTATFMTDLQTFLRSEMPNRSSSGIGNRVVSGGIGSTSASLSHTISTVKAYVEGYYVYDDSISHTYTASRDTFVLLRYNDATTFTIPFATITYDGNFVFATMANSTAEISAPSGSMLLFEVVTDGTSITTVNDYRSGGIVFLSDSLFADGVSGRLNDAVSTLGALSCLVIIDCDDNVLADTTIPSTMDLYFFPGNELIIASTKTVTINSPQNIHAGKRQKIKSGSGTIAFTNPGTVSAMWLCDNDGTSDGEPELKELVDALHSIGSGEVFFPAGNGYVIGTTWDGSVNTDVVLSFENGARLSIEAGATLTLPSPANIIAAPTQQIKTGDGTLLFAYSNGTSWVAWRGASPTATATVNRAAIQESLNDIKLSTSDALGYYTGELKFSPGVYSIDDQLTIANETTGAIIKSDGFVRLLYTGSVDSSKAVIRITASSGNSIDSLTIDGIGINANSKTGYCVIAESNSVTTRSVKNCTFKNAVWESATVANFLGGDVAEPCVNDIDFSSNLFDHMIFYNAPYNVKLNGFNVYATKFDTCTFGSNVTAAVKQHARLIYGASTTFESCQFAALSHDDSVGADRTACVYTKNRGGLFINNGYSEEFRILSADTLGSNDTSINVNGVYVNDTRTDDSNGTDFTDITTSYFVYNVNSNLKITNVHPAVQGLALYRRIYTGEDISLTQVDLGSLGYIDFSSKRVRAKSVIDGIKPGTLLALNKNWDLARWRTNDGTSDHPFVYTKYEGASGVSVLLRSASNDAYGGSTAHINCSVASTTYCTGLELAVRAPTSGVCTFIFTGTLDAVTTTPKINFVAGGIGGTNNIINADKTFISWALADLSAEATANTSIRFGISPNITGEMWIDTATLYHGEFTNGTHSAFINALPDPISPAIYAGTIAPTIALPWDEGDIIWNNSMASGGVSGWMCITAGSPGTWEKISTLAP